MGCKKYAGGIGTTSEVIIPEVYSGSKAFINIFILAADIYSFTTREMTHSALSEAALS
jgi:hypothetical protein